MNRSNFKEGAIVATLAIVLVKVIGILYVIPFYAIIGEKGGALYGYAYSIYTLFLSLSTVGIPLAMSKLVSEYSSIDQNFIKEKVFKIGKKIILIMSLVCFLALFLFSDSIANMIIGDISGGNTKDDVSFVIKIVSTAILIVPSLSVTRGYLQGHKFIKPSSISQVIEQVVRVLIIILGSFFAIKVFKTSLNTAVGIAVFGATGGGIASYFYLIYKIKKNKEKLNTNSPCTRKEAKISSKILIKKILAYSIPFILIGLVNSFYGFVNTLFSIKVMVNDLNYSITDAEAILSVFTTWGIKLNMIITSIGTGLVVSLIPNISASFAKKDMADVKKKINLSFEMLLYFIIPMTIGLSLLSKPVWNIFYGPSKWGSLVFSVYVFNALFMTLYIVSLSIMQSINKFKMVFLSIFIGIVVKILLIKPLMISFQNMGFYAFSGMILSTIIGYLIVILINYFYLVKNIGLDVEKSFVKFLKIIWGVLLMSLIIILLRKYVFTFSSSKLYSILEVVLYTLIGGIVYFISTFKVFKSIFGDKYTKKIKGIIKK